MRSAFISTTTATVPCLDDMSSQGGHLNKGHSRTLLAVHTGYARLLTELLNDFTAGQPVSLASVEDTTAGARAARHPRLAYRLYFAAAQPHAGSIELSGELASALLDHLLNYRGAAVREPHRLSEIEAQLLSRHLEMLLERYAESWKEIVAFQAVPEEPTHAPTSAEPLFVATYQVPYGHGASGQLAIALRLSAWGAVLGRQARAAGDAPAAGHNIGLLDAIGETALTARAVLGTSRISIEDFISLRVGDVICLDQDADAPVEIRVGSRSKLLGEARIQNGRYVITVEDIITRGGE